MSNVDDELRKVLADLDRNAQESKEDPEESASNRKRNLGLLATLLVMGVAVVALVLGSKSDAIYSKGVDQLLEEASSFEGRQVRVQGILVSGSLEKRDDPCEYRFRMQKNNKSLEVRYPQCIVPDTFRDMKGVDVEVTAEGKLNAQGFLEATQIFAKCPSKYEMKDKQANGEAPPHMMPENVQPIEVTTGN